MATGKIKWFDRGTGYGFIRPDEAGKDVFFHQSAICEPSECPLQLGDEVSFKAEANERGPEAIAITITASRHEKDRIVR
jgi:CspA family cold shock protein